MIFPEEKLKIASKMLEAAWDSCPLEAEAAGQHWMAAATMVQVIIDYDEAVWSAIDYEEAVRSAVDYREGGENDAAFDEGTG